MSRVIRQCSLLIGVFVLAVAAAGMRPATRHALQPVPSFTKNGGFIVTIKTEGGPPTPADLAALEKAIRGRVDPEGKHGVEFTPSGDAIELRVPKDHELAELSARHLREQQDLAKSGVPTDVLAILALNVDSHDMGSAEEARTTVLKIALAHPAQSAAIRAFVKTSAEWAEREGWIDSPEEFAMGLDRMGVLELRIAAQPDDVKSLTAESTKGVAAPAGYVWRPIRSKDDWINTQSEPERGQRKQELEKDPNAFFAKLGLVSSVRDGQVCLLLCDAPQTSLTRAQPGWCVKHAFESRDSSDRPGVYFSLNEKGGQLLQAVTAPSVGKCIAVLVDGKVYSAPHLMSSLSGAGSISGAFDYDEARRLTSIILHPLPMPIKVIDTRVVPAPAVHK